MSSTTKGNQIELMAARYLETKGFYCQRAQRTMRPIGKGRYVSAANDFFGVFDIVAVSPGAEPVRFIQTTMGRGNAWSRRKKVEEEAYKFPVHHICSIEVWRWVGGGKKRRKDGGWTRRQYFEQRALENGVWVDVTPEKDGWVD